MPAETPDGTLRDWTEIADAYPWQTLLLGNGLSINVWPRFEYGALFNYAEGLTDHDRALFQDTPNFERVLGDLNIAIRLGDVFEVDTQPFDEGYRRVQLALGHAIRAVHLNRDRVPGATRAAIRAELCNYEWIFTTSYDLIIYWAMGYGGWAPFVDGFRFGDPACEFDAEKFVVWPQDVPVFFLHGALHLVVGGSGVTWKLRRGAVQTLLAQFGQPIESDPQARPLLVTEGSAHDKLQAIEGNAYLTHVLERLRQRQGPVVVFGSRLSDRDGHIAEALSKNPDRPVAVSMMPGAKRELAPQQIDIYGRLEAKPLMFFDATSHPLGSPGLRAPLP